jgi:hypothetical protein
MTSSALLCRAAAITGSRALTAGGAPEVCARAGVAKVANQLPNWVSTKLGVLIERVGRRDTSVDHHRRVRYEISDALGSGSALGRIRCQRF